MKQLPTKSYQPYDCKKEMSAQTLVKGKHDFLYHTDVLTQDMQTAWRITKEHL